MICYRMGVPIGYKAGHYCDPHKGPATPWGEGRTQLYDWHPERDGVKMPRLDLFDRGRVIETEGEFVHLVVDGWTLLAAWDRSADKRGGCTMSFAFNAELTQEQAMAEARERWPRIFSRIEQHVGAVCTVRRAVLPS